MAHPIEPTVLKKHDYELLIRDLKDPAPSEQARKIYEAGKVVHERLHKK